MKKKADISNKNIRLTLLLGINIFILINLILASAGLAGRVLIDAGVFRMEDYLHVRAVILLTVLISTAITLATTVRIRILYVKPYKKMIAAMQELAKGRFQTRIHLSNIPAQARETLEFADSFNVTADKLGQMELLNKDFMNNFSHEFKTPIASIQGFAKLIREEELTAPEIDDYLDIIIQESQRLSLLAGNILDLSKINAQDHPAHPEAFQIGEQIRQCLLLIQAKYRAGRIELQAEIEDTMFTGDQMMLKEVWLNIIDNAIKFSPEGGTVTVSGRCTAGFYEVRISDQGCGMSEETASRVFEKFYQGDTSHAAAGNGLGLAIAAKIVRLHGGEIKIKSTPGDGSTFTIMLPKQKEPVKGVYNIF